MDVTGLELRMKIEARELELEVRKVPVHFREYKADKQWPDTPSRISPTAEVTMGMTKRHLTLSPSTFEEVEQLVTSQLKSDLHLQFPGANSTSEYWFPQLSYQHY